MLRQLIIALIAIGLLAGLWLWLKPQTLATNATDLSLSYHLSVSSGVVAGPEVLIAREGFPVAISVTADVADLVHLHGYELQQPIQASETITLQFNANIAGRYLLELEDSAIPLASLEVYPK